MDKTGPVPAEMSQAAYNGKVPPHYGLDKHTLLLVTLGDGSCINNVPKRGTNRLVVRLSC